MIFCCRIPNRLRHQVTHFPECTNYINNASVLWSESRQAVCVAFSKHCSPQKSNTLTYPQPLEWVIVCHQSWGIYFPTKRKKGKTLKWNYCMPSGQNPGLVLTPSSDWSHPISRANSEPLGALRCWYLPLVTDALSDGPGSEWLFRDTESTCSQSVLVLPCLKEMWRHWTPSSGMSLPLVNSLNWRASDKIKVKQKTADVTFWGKALFLEPR